MHLAKLVDDMNFYTIQGNLKVPIESISLDSRKVEKDGLFIAIPGFTVDGHDYIPQAIKRGATALIVEREPSVHIEDSITILKVPDAREALAHVSAIFYDHPSRKLNLVGITGTNGKTSITYFLKSIYEKANQSVGIIGTTGLKINDQLIPINTSTPTTPESLDLQKLLNYMTRMHLNTCVMEVSSHALHLKRVSQTTFQSGIFINLSPDHLELHKNMDEYFQAKAKLFKLTSRYNIINIDDQYGKKLIQTCQKYTAKPVSYGIHHDADIRAIDIHYSLKGSTYTVQTPTGKAKIHVHLPGEIYVYNSLAAIATAYYEGIPMPVIQKGINAVENIDGRFEIIYEQNNFKVIIDFAHTEDALAQTLKTIRPYVSGRLILVFGVYADMSPNGQMKRKNMGKVAANYADFSVVTLDNPKYFDQQLIIDEITHSMDEYNGKYEAILDRKQAIEAAIAMSNDNDIIVITGKGHETTQVIQGQEIPFNEKEIVFGALAEKVI